jgi:hypothetical protein
VNVRYTVFDSASRTRNKRLMPHRLNPHMWTPYHGPEPYDEICHLCGVFSGAHHKRSDPAAARLPCPEAWPVEEPLTQKEMDEIERITDEAGGGPILVQLPPHGP